MVLWGYKKWSRSSEPIVYGGTVESGLESKDRFWQDFNRINNVPQCCRLLALSTRKFLTAKHVKTNFAEQILTFEYYSPFGFPQIFANFKGKTWNNNPW